MNSYYIDTHAHIFSEEFEEDRKEMLETCKERNVKRINIMCTLADEAKRAMDFSMQDPFGFQVSYGIFPCDVVKVNDAMLEELEIITKDPRCTCVGEIGLDYYWDKDEGVRKAQRELFVHQIQLAVKVNKPICVHSRDALQDTFDLMCQNPSRGLLHCYSGSKEMAEEFVKRGYYIALGGPVTFKNARHACEVVQNIDVRYLLSETDSPYMAPEPVRGTKNAPFNIPYIVKKMALLRECEEEELKEQIAENWTRFLRGEEVH